MASPIDAAAPTTSGCGSYNLKWFAADPAVGHAPYLPTFAKVRPTAMACPTPSGGAGRAADPMGNAVLGKPRDAVTSLAPRDRALGQIVPFEVEIAVKGSTSPANGRIQVVGRWNTKTTSGSDSGYARSLGIYCAFIDTADADNASLATGTKVDSFSSATMTNEQIEGTLNVSGLASAGCRAQQRETDRRATTWERGWHVG